MSTYRHADPLYRGGGSGGAETMGVYDHMMRPSMGHRMQVELRESMQNYHNNKNQLQVHLSELCLDSKDLYNSPPSPASSIKTWGEAGSRFSTAPEKAAKKVRLAKLEQENSTLSKGAQQNELKSKHTLLPPIPGKGNAMGAEAKEKTDSSCQSQEEQGDDSDKRNLRFGASVELKTPLKTKPTTAATTTTTATNNKANKFQKKGKGKKPALKEKEKEKEKEKQKPRSVLKLPIILPNNNKWAQWDSGCNHVHRKGKSTGLEKSQTEEDCRNFSQRSMAIPSTLDPKRMEIKLPPLAKPPANQPKVKFTGRQPKKSIPVDVVYMQSMPDDTSAAKAMVLDHFPHGDKRLPDFDDSSSSCAGSDDEADGPLNVSGQLLLPPLPVVRLSHHNLKQTTHHVPRLNLERITSPGLMSVETGRSGATGATYMSQETLEWKSEYMTSGNPDRKNRMLAEILHVVRQRMRDNEEDIRMAGDDPRPGDRWSMDGHSDIMVLDRNISPSSGATSTRSTARRYQKLLYPPRNRQMVVAGGSKTNSLHTYLHKLSHKRRAVEQRQRQRERVRFQLAHTTIREITQSSMGHRSNVQTAATSVA